MQEEWKEQERQDTNRIRFAAMVALAWMLFCTVGCAPKVLTAPSLSQSVGMNAAIKKNVATAQQDINCVLKDNAIIDRPDLTLTLQNANGELIQASATIGQQAAELATNQKQIDQVTAEGNAAIAAKNAMEPKHKRDIDALVVAWMLCSLACLLGPLLFKSYPALIFFPDALEGTVCSIAAFLICSGVASLLILFGVL